MKANLRNLSGLTVADLIAELRSMPKDARVMFVCDYGDYSHTKQALPVDSVEEIDDSKLVDSGYSQSGVALADREDDEAEPEDREATTVVILK